MNARQHGRPPFLQSRRLAAGVCALALLAPAAGCARQGKAAPVGGSDIPPSQVKLGRHVELAPAEQRALEYFVETVGYLEAEGQTDIAAGVTGVVDEVRFREGQQVDADTVLITVDQDHYVAAAEVARANEKRADENVRLKKDLSERTVRAGNGASDEERYRTLLEYRVAQAELLAAQANRKLAEHNLQRSRVRAPYTGQINQRKVTPGTYLEEKTVIGTMADLSRLRLVGWAPEKAAPLVRALIANQDAGRTARLAGCCLADPSLPWAGLATLALDAGGQFPCGLEFTALPFPEMKFYCRIFYMSTVASPDTHMFECKGEVKTGGAGALLRPGFTARIRLPVRGNPSACVIREESVRASERGFIAFVPVERTGKDGQPQWFAEERKVELGYRSPGWVEVLQGLRPGELVVRRGAEALENGTPIQFPEP
jgi:RND family efflux transporter MFP subunit